MNYVRRINPATPIEPSWDDQEDYLDKLFHLPNPAERIRFSEETERAYREDWTQRD